MGVKISDKLTPDGRKFEKMLKELAALETRVGFQAGEATDDKGVDICDIAAWNEVGTIHIPSRPFLRDSVDNNVDKINAMLKAKKQDLLSGASAEQVLKEIGLFQKDLIQETILEGSFEPNADLTIKRKGSDKPLVDTGRMLQSVNYVIKKKGSD